MRAFQLIFPQRQLVFDFCFWGAIEHASIIWAWLPVILTFKNAGLRNCAGRQSQLRVTCEIGLQKVYKQAPVKDCPCRAATGFARCGRTSAGTGPSGGPTACYPVTGTAVGVRALGVTGRCVNVGDVVKPDGCVLFIKETHFLMN